MATIEIKMAAYRNGDDVQLYWRALVNGKTDEPIPGCLGFVIERQRLDKHGDFGPTEVLRNRVGFKDGSNSEEENTVDDQMLSQPSNIWPFQNFSWTDHGANTGQTVKYRVGAVSAVAGQEPGSAPLKAIEFSKWSAAIEVSADCDNGVSAYFNRGFVMSQFVSRVARENGWEPKEIKNHIKDIKEPLRRFMSGELRLALLALTNEVIENTSLELYAALFELLDDELIQQLKLLRGRAHVVLANGADKSGDENDDARDELRGAKVDVKDRLLGSKGLGHNKFAVVYNKKTKKAIKVWTGSTNWAPTGLCTQVNNGILIEDGSVAHFYFEHWKDLVAAKNDFTPELIANNAKSPSSDHNIDVWFTPIRKHSTKNKDLGADLNELVDLVKGTKKALLYVMFQPGSEPLKTIMNLPNDKIVKGVVSTLSSKVEESFKLHGTEDKEYKSKLVVPEGVPISFSYWIKEVSRRDFLGNIGFAITHSKMIVIDPLSDDCTVITGSHNFSESASEKNDENFLVIKKNKKLAEAYAVACLATYAHYRWRAYVHDQIASKKKIWSHLSDKDSWQKGCLTDDVKATLAYWC